MTLRHAALGALALLGCAPLEDTVFSARTLEPGPPIAITEGQGLVELPLRLSRAPRERVAARFRLVGIEAQNDCQTPDFEAAEGRVEWLPGSVEARVRAWVSDDDLAETDERFAIEIEPLEGLPESESVRVEVVIADDDRDALLIADVAPGLGADRSVAIQAALDQAAAAGRGVVVIPPGDYAVTELALAPGTTLSGRGARFVRPAQAAPEVVTLSVRQTGADVGAPALIEGLTIDGQREAQGPYRDHERQDAHLLELAGDPGDGGQARASLERLTLLAGTASGVMIGPEVEATLCGLEASELFRDAVTVTGGGTTVRLRNIDASASEGTGLWLGARTPGYANSYALVAEVEDVQIGAGDVEIEATTGSNIAIRRLTMTRAPFRLDAPDGVVRIADSVLVVGLRSAEHDYFGRPHDVEITGTIVIASESSVDGSADAPRSLSAVTVVPETIASGNIPNEPGRLVFDTCRFERAGDVDADDTVYALSSTAPDVSILVRNGELGAGLTDWFGAECSGCSMEP